MFLGFAGQGSAMMRARMFSSVRAADTQEACCITRSLAYPCCRAGAAAADNSRLQ